MRAAGTAWFEPGLRVPAGPVLVRDGIWALALDHPGGFPPYTWCYLLRDSEGGLHLVDPASDTGANWQSLRDALADIGAEPADVRSIVGTHLHRDHLGMADRLRQASGATLAIHREEQRSIDLLDGPGWPRLRGRPWTTARWGVPESRRLELEVAARSTSNAPRARADVLLEDGDLLDIPGRSVRVLWTPGHTSGHACLADDENLLLFSGDHVLPSINPGVGLGGDAPYPVADYLRSLAVVAALDGYEVCPGHEHPFRNLGERCEQLVRHHLHRHLEIARAASADPGRTVWEVAQHVTWSSGLEQLRGGTLRSALAQVEMHLDQLAHDPLVLRDA